MSTNKNLFKEAIADAKAVREAALKNAKAVLEEALTPQLQSMYAAKLQEMEDEELEETFTSAHAENDGDNLDYNLEEEYEEEGLEEDFDLSEILAELDAEEMEEAKKKNKVMGSKKAEKANKETYPGSKEEPYSGLDEAKEDGEEEDGEEAQEVGEMSVEDLKDLIKSIIDQEMEAEEEETPADEAGEESGKEDNDVSGDDEINLDELLAELDALNEEEEEEGLEEVMIPIKKINSKFSGALKGLKGYTAAKGINKYGMEKGTKNGAQPVKEADDKEEMEEALSTIKFLRKELNEVNLLNAKLLYVNKIFKAKNLSEAQKLKVIAHFDKATNVKEAKMVYESLNSALKAPAKRTIKESLGFASKAAGMAPNRTIVESNDVISRMQKLANIIK
jgi:hypothetical protein